MERERWLRVNELFGEAADRPAAERSRFLDRACEGDQALRAEVDSLLASHQDAQSFIESPVFELAPELLVDPGSPPLAGRHIGSYEVIREIGRGGMGVVYLGRDLRLGREVALKALAPEFTRDEHRRQRLRREARAAATLSHPGIATIYALDEIEDALYIVSEYVRGRTLRDMLEGGELPSNRVLPIAASLAAALDAAHEQGIVHRDLKPENVMVTTGGTIKILDFGLARMEPERHPSGLASTFLTEAGTLLGTPAYMSPEQLEGGTGDARSDVFSFGVVLYEIATGRHPFQGGSAASTAARILTAEPAPMDVGSLPHAGTLEAVIRRCLEKDPARRFDSGRELRTVLDRGSHESSEDLQRPTRFGVDDPEHVTSTDSRLGPRWWWRFHQMIVSVRYVAIAYPMWLVKEWMVTNWGVALFFAFVALASLNGTLRMHLLFTERFVPLSLREQTSRVARWLLWSDCLVSALLFVAATAITPGHTALAALLTAVGIIGTATVVFVEPLTTRAAFEAATQPRKSPPPT